MTTSPATPKDADAFRTIGEVAEALKLPQHVLRFWETRFVQIKPLKRAGGRRFYRPQDVELVGAIRQLLYGEGYTIKGVQRILREQGPRAVASLARDRGTAADVALAAILQSEPESGRDSAEDPGGDRDALAKLHDALAELAACRSLLLAADDHASCAPKVRE